MNPKLSPRELSRKMGVALGEIKAQIQALSSNFQRDNPNLFFDPDLRQDFENFT